LAIHALTNMISRWINRCRKIDALVGVIQRGDKFPNKTIVSDIKSIGWGVEGISADDIG